MADSCIYFDHAATSWPKPAVVAEAIRQYLGATTGNPGRSGHRMSIAAAEIVEQARDVVAEFFNVGDPSRIAFAKNATEALNLAIYSQLKPGDHAITSSVEHNSVMRPLRYLEQQGVELTVVECTREGVLNPVDIASAIQPNTRLLVTTHASNVMGTLLPVKALSKLAREHHIPYLLDASQTAGVVPVDINELPVDMLAFTGHKGLLGPTGTGGLYVREGLNLTPLLRGGTGSNSEHETQPEFMPDSLEGGTLNVLGLAGLTAAIGYLQEIGVNPVWQHEQKLLAHFLTGAKTIAGLTVYGVDNIEQRCGAVSFNIQGASCSEVSLLLDKEYGIMSRAGLHCAPGAHRTQGTLPEGSVRFGLGYSNTEAEVYKALEALQAISNWAAKKTEKKQAT